MKHVAFFFLFTVGLLFQIFALSLDVTPEVGYAKGESGEYVFYPDSPYSDDKLSELLWDYGFLYVGAKTGFRGERFSLENGVRFCVASEKDTMSDSDWQNVAKSGLGSYQYKTNYSESDNILCRSVSVNTKASYTFKPLSWLNLSPFVAVDFDYMRFCAKDGWYEYGKEGKYYNYAYDDKAHNSKGTFSGTVMRYKRWDVSNWLGLDAALLHPAGLRAIFSLAFSTFFFSADVDDHVLRDMTFVDFATSSFCAYKTGVTAECDLSERCTFGCSVFFTKSAIVRGFTYMRGEGEKYYSLLSDSEGAMSVSKLDIAAFARIRVF